MYRKTFVRLFGSDYKLAGYINDDPTADWLNVYFTQEQLERFQSSPLYKTEDVKSVQIETETGMIQAYKMTGYHFVEYASTDVTKRGQNSFKMLLGSVVT